MRYHCRYYDAPVADVLSGKIDLDEVRKDLGVFTDENRPLPHVPNGFAGSYDSDGILRGEPQERYDDRRFVALASSESLLDALPLTVDKTGYVVEVAPVVDSFVDGELLVDPTSYKRFVVEKTVVVRRVARAV